MTEKDVSPQELLSGYRADVRARAEALRVLVKQAAPGASETVYVGWRAITYAHRREFCSIMPHARHVNLAFHEGAALPDPQGLLQGTGRMMRHVRIEADQQIHSAALTALIEAAAERAR